jgi:hypothetical protein
VVDAGAGVIAGVGDIVLSLADIRAAQLAAREQERM